MGQSNQEKSKGDFTELIADENKFTLALKNSTIVVACVDKNLRYRWIYNPHSDFDAIETIGKRDDELNDCQGSRELMDLKRETINKEKSFNKVISFELSDGEIIYNFNSEPLYNDDGELIGATTVSMDITEYELLKKRIVKLEKFSAIDKLVSGVAHEFNNLLAVIMGNVQLFLRKNKDKISKVDYNRFEIVIDKCLCAKKITYNLMKLSTTESIRKEDIKLSVLLNEVVTLFRKDLIQYNIKIKKELEINNLDNINIIQMKTIFMNLISNSIHAIIPKKRGVIKIKSYLKKDKLVITFSDNGIGIKEEIIDKIFDPFFTTKGGYSQKEFIEGTGLGLAIVYKYIKNHNGEIKVKSKLKQGTKIIIELPLKKEGND
ncbi:MAG: two-component system sensor histidine kinase NtrB [Candidatus Woesearchaeota archaeon]